MGMFGTYLGAAVANARAFEEIQRLKTQLEQQNAYLEEEVLEARAFGDLIVKAARCARSSARSIS